MMDTDSEPIMISAIQHWSYCPRQCGLIHLEQVFEDNIHTMRGHVEHERVDDPGAAIFEGVRTERALPIWSERLGLTGRCDIVEFYPDGRIFPVEYKHGRKREKIHDELQLVAQGMCLEEMIGRPVISGAIFHYGSRRRREVYLTPDLRKMVENVVKEIRNMMRVGRLPAPVADDRCKECSLVEVCQPHAIGSVSLQHRMSAILFELEE